MSQCNITKQHHTKCPAQRERQNVRCFPAKSSWADLAKPKLFLAPQVNFRPKFGFNAFATDGERKIWIIKNRLFMHCCRQRVGFGLWGTAMRWKLLQHIHLHICCGIKQGQSTRETKSTKGQN